MRLGTGQASAQFTLLSWLSATGGATNCQGLFLFGFHGYMMQPCSENKMFNCDHCKRNRCPTSNEPFIIRHCHRESPHQPSDASCGSPVSKTLRTKETVLQIGPAVLHLV